MKALIVFGTRPEIIKLAPVYFKLKESNIETRILFTRQHNELADDVLKFFNIKPEYNERCMLVMDEERRLGNIRTIIRAVNPDIVIVQGDTFTTYAGAYSAFLLKKPILHLEAGLRTYKKFSPYPEEVFRTLTTRLADFHFVPTQRNFDNLIKEGIAKDRIFITGNTIVDATNMTTKLINEKSALTEILNQDSRLVDIVQNREFVIITSHRRENIGKPLKQICRSVIELAKKYPKIEFVWLMHKNPLVREIVIFEMEKRPNNLKVIEAVSYPTLLYMIKRSRFILTDSGGIQEEVVTFNKPIIILREDTERPEVVDEGLGILVGSDQNKIIDTFSKLHDNPDIYKSITKLENPYGDGRTSERVVNLIQHPEVHDFLKDYPNSYQHKFIVKDLL